MASVVQLLGRCGVDIEGAHVYEYATRRSASTYAVAQDGAPRRELRLVLPDGLSFVERVGFRYCVDKALRASAAAAYWRMVKNIGRQRLRMAVVSAPTRAGTFLRAGARAGRDRAPRDRTGDIPALLPAARARSLHTAALEGRAAVPAAPS
jgi:hypothetical protein